MKYFMFILVMLAQSFSAFANQAEDIEGVWLNERGTGYIEFKITNDVLNGTVIGSPRPEDDLRKDTLNPDPNLRERLIKGVTILQGFNYVGKGKWTGGTIYDPDNGKTYDCKITVINDNEIKIRGFVGISLFGRTEIWKRES